VVSVDEIPGAEVAVWSKFRHPKTAVWKLLEIPLPSVVRFFSYARKMVFPES
jgi:hypothetical protein